MKNLKKLFKTGALTIMAVAMAASMSTIAFADAQTGSFVSSSTVAGQDWEGSYGNAGYLVMAGSGGGSTTSVYSDLYQDNDGTSVIYGTGAYGYKTLVSTDKTAATALTLKTGAPISDWGVSAGTEKTEASIKNSLYVPGTSTPTYACVHNSGNNPWYVHTTIKTAVDNLYITVYIPGNYESTAIDETNYLDVGLYSGYINRQVCGTAEDQTAATAWAYYTNAGLSKLASTKVTSAGTYVTFQTGVAGDYTIILGSESDAVASGVLKIMLGGVFFDTTEPEPTAPAEFVSNAGYDKVGSAWEARVGRAGYVLPTISDTTKAAYSNLFNDADADNNNLVLLNGTDAFALQYGTGALTSTGGYKTDAIAKDIYTNMNVWKTGTYITPYIPGTTTQTNGRAMGNQVSGTYQSNAVNCYAGYSFTTTANNVYVTLFVTPAENSAANLKDNTITVGVWKGKQCNNTNNGAGAYLEESGNLGCAATAKETVTAKGGYITFLLKKAGTYFIGASVKNNEGTYVLGNIGGLFFDTVEPDYGSRADAASYNTYDNIGGNWASYNEGAASYGKQGYLIATLDSSSNPAYYNKGIFTGTDGEAVTVAFNNKLDGTHCWGVMTPANGYQATSLITNVAVNCHTFGTAPNRLPYAPGTTTEPGVRVQGDGSGTLGYSFTTTQANVYVTMYVVKNGSAAGTFTVSAYYNYTVAVRQSETSATSTKDGGVLPAAEATQVITNKIGAYVTFKLVKAGTYFIGANVDSGSVIVPALFVDTTAPADYVCLQTAEAVSYNKELDGDWEGTYGSAGYFIPGYEDESIAYTKNILSGDEDGTKATITTTVAAQTRTVTSTFSGSIVSSIKFLAATFQKGSTSHYLHNLYVPGTDSDERVVGRICGSATTHAAAYSFTVTEDAFDNYADEDGYIYVSMYNAFAHGFSQESIVYKAALYKGEAFISNTNAPVWCTKNGDWQGSPLATTAFTVKLVSGYFVTFRIKGAGTYTIATVNNMFATAVGSNGLFFDSAAPANPSAVEEIPVETEASKGTGTAEYVQTDKYAVSDWSSTYGADGYFFFGTPIGELTSAGFYSAAGATVYTKGILGDGSATAILANANGLTTSGGAVTWASDYTIAANAIFDRVYITGSLNRPYGKSANCANGLYIPGTSEKVSVETGSAHASDNIPYGITINKTDASDMYITMYMYPNSYNTTDAEKIYTAGVLAGKYTLTHATTDDDASGYNTNSLRYQIRHGDATVKLAEQTGIDVSTGGKYVTFKVTGTGLYTFYVYTTNVKNGACLAGLFFDKTLPVYNKPQQVINNTNLTDENDESVVDTFFGSAAKAAVGAEAVPGNVFTNSQVSATQASFEIGSTTKYYTSVLLSKGGSTLNFYRKYTTEAVSGDPIYSYTVPAGDVPVMVTFKVADSFTVAVDGDAQLQGVYFDTGLPSTYTYKLVGTDKATGSDWEGVYGSAGYYIPYFNTDDSAISFYTADSQSFLTSMNYSIEGMAVASAYTDAHTYLADNSESYLKAPGSDDLVECWMKASSTGASIYGFKVADETERYVTVALYQYWKASWTYSNTAYAPDIVVEVFAGDDISAANSGMRAVSKFVVEDVDFNAYVTFKAQGSFVIKVSLAKDSNNAVVGNNAAVEGIFFDTANPVPTTYKATVSKTGNIVTLGRMYTKANGSISFKVVDIAALNSIEQELDAVKVGDNVLTADANGIYTIANVTADVAVSISSKAKAAVAPTITLSDDVYADTNGSLAIVTLTAGTNVTILSSGIVIDGLKFKTSTATDVLVYAIGLDGDGEYIGGKASGDTITYKGYVTYKDLTDNKTYTVYSEEVEYTLNDDAEALDEEVVPQTNITKIASLTSPTDGYDYTISLTATASAVKYNKFTVTPVATGAHGTATYTYKLDNGAYKALPSNGIITGLKIDTTYVVTIKVVDVNGIEATYSLTQKTASTVDYTITLEVSEDEITQNSISVIASATNNVGTTKYYFKLNDGEEIESDEGAYMFEELTAGTEYTITVRVVDANNATKTETITLSTEAAPAKKGCGGAIAMLSAFMGVIALAVVGKKY